MKKHSHTNFGTICYLPNNDLNWLLLALETSDFNVSTDWYHLIVILESQTYLSAWKKIKIISEKSPLIATLILPDEWQAETKAPIAVRVIEAIKAVKTPYIAFLGENAKPNFDTLSEISKLLKEEKDIAAISGRNIRFGTEQVNSKKNHDYSWFDPGQGINSFGLNNLDPQPIIYQIPSIKKHNIFDRFENELRAYKNYPFVGLNILLSPFFKTLLCTEGLGREVQRCKSSRELSNYFGPRSYGQICDQLIALRNGLFEAFMDANNVLNKHTFDIKEFYSAYINLCSKLVESILIQSSELYVSQKMNMDLIARSFSIFCLSAVETLPDYSKYERTLKTKIVGGTNQALESMIIEKQKHSTMPSLFYSESQLNHVTII